MEKKIWSNAEVVELGVEMTMKNDHNATSHYCHKTNPETNPTSSCEDKQSDHNANGNKGHIFTGNICPEHVLGGKSACCCYS